MKSDSCLPVPSSLAGSQEPGKSRGTHSTSSGAGGPVRRLVPSSHSSPPFVSHSRFTELLPSLWKGLESCVFPAHPTLIYRSIEAPVYAQGTCRPQVVKEMNWLSCFFMFTEKTSLRTILIFIFFLHLNMFPLDIMLFLLKVFQ